MLLEQINESGISKSLQQDFEKIIDRWQSTEVHIGLVGESGVGKSSFLNAICGLADDHKDAAATGVKETTTERAKYVHPDNSKIVFWDLPGSDGRSDQELESYYEKIMLHEYDICFILHSKRFRRNDILLAQKVKSLGKPFLLIRTHIDNDMASEERKLKGKFNEEELKKLIKDDTKKLIKDNMKTRASLLGEKETDVYLISNRFPEKWEFPLLTEVILGSLPKLQRECLTLFTRNISTGVLKDKVAILRGRVRVVATISALRRQKIPGLATMANADIISKEIDFYKLRLGLRSTQHENLRGMNLENQAVVAQEQMMVALASILTSISEENIDSSWSLGDLEIDRSCSAISLYLSNYLDTLEKDAEDRLKNIADQAAESYDIN